MSDIVGGFFAGVTQTVIGHPFDTIKVLIQNKKPWYNIGMKNYYRGFNYPLVGSIIINSVSFSSFERNLKDKNYFESGFYSGLIIFPIVHFFDIGKIKLQTKAKFNINSYLKMNGMFMTLTRETIGNSIYFGTYYYMTRELEYGSLISGGIAGLLNWTLTYPFDTLRSRQMSKNISLKKAIKIGNFWSGYSACAIRAILVNSISFTVYDLLKKN